MWIFQQWEITSNSIGFFDTFSKLRSADFGPKQKPGKIVLRRGRGGRKLTTTKRVLVK